MSFNIDLQINNSENNRLVKSISTISTITGTLKNSTSIIDPVIIIEGNLSNFVNCNYMTISTFGRSYFVTDIKSIGKNLIEISGHVDVLSTYANEIKNNTAIVKRQQNRWNLYLNDGVFKVYQNPLVLTKAFPSGFTRQELVLAVAGS